MPNPLYQQFGGSQYGSMQGMVNRFNQFRRNFQGDPRAMVQQMLNSGQVSQARYDEAVKTANALRSILKL